MSLGAVVMAGALAFAAYSFDLEALPASPPGERAWNISASCERSDVRRTQALISGAKRLITMHRSANGRRMPIEPSISAVYVPWRATYSVVFDLGHPHDVAWIATCLHVAGADPPMIKERGLHMRGDRPLVDLEYAPEVGLYYVVR